MKLHLIALPHVRLGTDMTHLCAYSAKVMKFCKMMGANHEILLYAPESDPVPGAALVQCLSEHARIATFGKDDPNRLYAWPTDAQCRIFNLMAAAKLAEHAEPRDLALLAGGLTHKLIKDAVPELMYAEPFCGYEGILTDKVAFESYAHMNETYRRWDIKNIRWYDRVIPPFCDPDEFPQLNDGKGDYLLFLGRLIARKGPAIAFQIAQACEMPLVVAGPGGQTVVDMNLSAPEVTLKWDPAHPMSTLDYRGPVNIQERAKLMAGARAFICPTTYSEPGGNVAIEAMLAGTPVIAPDFGVFSETIQHRVSGFHFRTLREAVSAVRDCEHLKPSEIRRYAMERYSLEAIAPKYDAWFSAIHDLWGKGWDTL